MTTETKYSYQKKIEALKAEAEQAKNDLWMYRQSVLEIYDGIAEVAGQQTSISIGWTLKKLRRLLR